MGLEEDRSNEEGYEWMNFFPMRERKEREKKKWKRDKCTKIIFWTTNMVVREQLCPSPFPSWCFTAFKFAIQNFPR